ncbi:MAG TPA: GntR family transcriptional regulator [Usitatibacter sp.]|nr:GntR family transcriptional regulator [Usitatibacter sp.]
MASIAPIAEARLLRVDIFHELRQDILACRLAPGAELREGELAERFSVSKSPVRDALSRLVQEGLVHVMPRQGYRVAPISLRDVRDMFQYRAVLEGACARIAAGTASNASLDTLEPFREFDTGRHADGFIGYNRAFHQALARLSGNARLMGAVASQIDQMDRVVTMSLDAMRQRDPTKLVAQHAGIIDALQKREARRAQTLVSRHVEEAQRRVCAALLKLAVVE